MALDHVNFKPWSGTGIVTAYKRNPTTGAIASGGYDFGEALIKLGRTAGKVELKTVRDPSRGVAFRMGQSKSGDLEIVVKTLPPFVEQLIHGGTWTEYAASAAVAGWAAPAGIEVGMVIKLPAENVSAVTVTDNAGKVLPATQYVLDAFAGTVRPTDLTTGGAYTQPLKVSYTPGARKVLGGFKMDPSEEYFVQASAWNGYNNERKLVQVYKVQWGQDGQDDWIQQDAEFGAWTIKGSMLIDTTRAATAPGGQFYSIVNP